MYCLKCPDGGQLMILRQCKCCHDMSLMLEVFIYGGRNLTGFKCWPLGEVVTFIQETIY